jgi:poly(3-hydroxybutyrate) depolymerase
MLPVVVYEPPAPAKALILALHGFTESGPDMRSYSKLDNVGQQLGARVVYPSAPGATWTFWNRNRSLEIQGLNSIRQQYAAGGLPVAIVGFSADACMANTVATAFPSWLEAVVSYAGYLESNLTVPVTANAPSVLAMRNQSDELVKAPQVAATVSDYKAAAWPVSQLYPNPPDESGFLGSRGHFWDVAQNPAIESFLAGALFRQPARSNDDSGPAA